MNKRNELPANESQPNKPHLSASGLGLFNQCPEAYRRRYIEGEKSKPNLNMTKGKAFHKAVELNMTEKIKTGKELPLVDMADACRDEMSDGLNDSDDNDDAGYEATDVILNVEQHLKTQSPDYQPTAVEIPFRIELDSCGHDYVGFIDMVGTLVESGDPVIVDWKTSKKKPIKNAQHDSVQLTGYYASQAAELGTNIEVRLDYITSNKKGRLRHVQSTRRDADDVAALAQRIDIASKTIEAGLFPPASASGWWCGASWCQYHSTCKFVNPKRREKEHAREQVKAAMDLISINEGNDDGII